MPPIPTDKRALPAAATDPFQSLTEILERAHVGTPAVVFVWDPASNLDRTVVEKLGKGLTEHWKSHTLLITKAGVSRLIGEGESMATSRPDPEVAQLARRLPVGRAYGRRDDGWTLVSPLFPSGAAIVRMRQLLDTDVEVETLVDAVTERIREHLLGLRDDRNLSKLADAHATPLALFGRVCAGCPDGSAFDAFVNEAESASAPFVLFLPSESVAVLDEATSYPNVEVVAYDPLTEPLASLLLDATLLQMERPLFWNWAPEGRGGEQGSR